MYVKDRESTFISLFFAFLPCPNPLPPLPHDLS